METLQECGMESRKYLHSANLAKMRATPKFKYGVEIPRHYNHAIQLDQVNGNNKWQEAIDSELQSLDSTIPSKTWATETKLPHHLIIRNYEFILFSMSKSNMMVG